MPDLVLEVLSLEVQLLEAAVDSKSGQGVAAASVASATTPFSFWTLRCEVTPAWDASSLCFATDMACFDHFGRAEWKASQQYGEELLATSEVSAPEPLMALLVATPPPGGVAQLAAKRLHIKVFLHGPCEDPAGDGQDIASSKPNVFESSVPLGLPLRQLITKREGETALVRGQAPWQGKGLVPVIVAAGAVVAWVPAPKGIRDLVLELPAPTQTHAVRPFPRHDAEADGGSAGSRGGRGFDLVAAIEETKALMTNMTLSTKNSRSRAEECADPQQPSLQPRKASARAWEEVGRRRLDAACYDGLQRCLRPPSPPSRSSSPVGCFPLHMERRLWERQARKLGVDIVTATSHPESTLGLDAGSGLIRARLKVPSEDERP
eukprot:TRINITY_DN48943_c0_g1_i1.p1 TRINITY_DN48943_c0_g1~~TRINITY_DN48943_c0_g1_i1.p1  ORF type:complete len:378 (-),score=68.23 TRINITY_DN48943_c0_g1_i1:233-1366(-)